MGKEFDLDKFDRQIIQILKKDAKISHHEIAEQIGLSTSSCQRRVKALEDANVILGYQAIINKAALDEAFGVMVAIILTNHQQSTMNQFLEETSHYPQIKQVHHIAGEYDYLIEVRTPDIASYERFAIEKIGSIKCVSRWISFIVMSSYTND